MDETLPDLGLPIGEVVRRWREHHGWSLTDYAARAGLTKGYVSEVERNRIARPKSPQLVKLARPFGLTEWDLISRRTPLDQGERGGAGPPGPNSGRPATAGKSAGFTFGSPTNSARGRPTHADQLRRIQAHVEELRGMLERLAADMEGGEP